MNGEANIARINGKVDHPERNRIVLEKKDALVSDRFTVVNLLSIGEALELRNRVRNAGIEVVNDRQPVRVSNIPENVSRFRIGTNVYRMYAL